MPAELLEQVAGSVAKPGTSYPCRPSTVVAVSVGAAVPGETDAGCTDQCLEIFGNFPLVGSSLAGQGQPIGFQEAGRLVGRPRERRRPGVNVG